MQNQRSFIRCGSQAVCVQDKAAKSTLSITGTETTTFFLEKISPNSSAPSPCSYSKSKLKKLQPTIRVIGLFSCLLKVCQFSIARGICTLDPVPCLLVRDFSAIYTHGTAAATKLCGRCRSAPCRRGSARARRAERHEAAHDRTCCGARPCCTRASPPRAGASAGIGRR